MKAFFSALTKDEAVTRLIVGRLGAQGWALRISKLAIQLQPLIGRDGASRVHKNPSCKSPNLSSGTLFPHKIAVHLSRHPA